MQSRIQNLAVPLTSSGVFLNVVTGATGTSNGVAGWDLNAWNSLGFWVYAPVSGGIVATGQTLTNLAPGALVDGNSNLVQEPFGLSTAVPGNFQVSATNYVGFSFINESDGALHFGWMSVILGSTFTDRTIGEIWYEADGRTGIAVGAGPGVPEPSTAALLAAGAAGLAVLRRRRSA